MHERNVLLSIVYRNLFVCTHSTIFFDRPSRRGIQHCYAHQNRTYHSNCIFLFDWNLVCWFNFVQYIGKKLYMIISITLLLSLPPPPALLTLFQRASHFTQKALEVLGIAVEPIVWSDHCETKDHQQRYKTQLEN